MKVIRIDDVIHQQLKREAKAHGRTLQWWVENKLTAEDTIVTYTTKNIATASSEAIQEAEDKINNEPVIIEDSEWASLGIKKGY